MKRILSSEQSKDLALETISEIASIVKQTLGPGGNPIILQQFGQNPDGTPRYPLITKDGVTVAESVQFRNPAKNTIAQAILQVAKNTVNQAGDGTTTAIVLAEAMFKAGYRHLRQGVNSIQLYNDLKTIKDAVIQELDKLKVPIKPEDLVDVARISANGDEDIANKVADAIQAVGEDGHVDLQEGFSRETVLKVVEGAMYKQGWRKFGPLGSLLVNDKVRNVCELENPAVLLYAGEIKDVNELAEFLTNLYGKDERGAFANPIPTLILAYDFSDDVKNVIMQLKVQAQIPIAALKAPFDGSPNARTQMLEDLAVLLGGQVTARGIIDLKTVNDQHLGNCEKVVIGAEEVVFYNGKGSEDDVLKRVDDLKKQLELVMSDYDKENLRLRIGKLTGGIAVIEVGGDSELEMRERKDRIEDALCAAKVAITEGILPGGGFSLYSISKLLNSNSLATMIMKEALQAPIKQIISNVGENAEVILSHMPNRMGFDARKKEYTDLMRAGIVDPVKVTKSALENAVSIVGLLLTTGGAIVADTDSKDGMVNPLAGLLG
jgi:chaperonin GroEL